MFDYSIGDYDELAVVIDWDNLSYDEGEELLQNIITATINSDYSTYVNCLKYTDYVKYSVVVNEVHKTFDDIYYYEILLKMME